jgi:hypothetical protein
MQDIEGVVTETGYSRRHMPCGGGDDHRDVETNRGICPEGAPPATIARRGGGSGRSPQSVSRSRPEISNRLGPRSADAFPCCFK